MLSDVCVTEKVEKWQMRWESQKSSASKEIVQRTGEYLSCNMTSTSKQPSSSRRKNKSLHSTESSREGCDRKSQIVYIRWGRIQSRSSLSEGKIQGAVWTQEEHHQAETQIQYVESEIKWDISISYLVDFRNKADTCELGDKKEEFFRERIVVGISSDTIHKLLLQEADLTLDKAVQICQLNELAESDNKAVNQDPDVNVIKQKKIFKKQTLQYRQRKRKYCDTTHQPRKCPAFGVQCSLCNKYNHFASVVCLLSNRRNDHSRRQNNNRKPNPRSHTANFENADKVRNMASVINYMKSTTKTTTTIQVSVLIQI